MIVKDQLDFVSITNLAHKVAEAASTVYWLQGMPGVAPEVCRDARERDLMESFQKITSLLGYQIVKAEADASPAPSADVPMFKPRPGLSDAGVPV